MIIFNIGIYFKMTTKKKIMKKEEKKIGNGNVKEEIYRQYEILLNKICYKKYLVATKYEKKKEVLIMGGETLIVH